MYKVKSSLKDGFDVTVKSAGGNEYLLKMKEADGPMDMFTVAFSGCILMCAKGYFFRTYEIIDLAMDVDLTVDYDNRKCTALITVDYPELSAEDVDGILANIKLRCKISHLLSNDVAVEYVVQKQ